MTLAGELADFAEGARIAQRGEPGAGVHLAARMLARDFVRTAHLFGERFARAVPPVLWPSSFAFFRPLTLLRPSTSGGMAQIASQPHVRAEGMGQSSPGSTTHNTAST